MLNSVISFSIQNKLIIGLFILGLISYGTYEATRLPIDAVPDITDNQVQIITVVPSLGAPDVERLITFPVEQVNSNIPGLKKIRSFSRFGLSVVTIVFEDDVDLYWARQQVNERLQKAQEQIPKAFGTPVLAPVTTGLGEIYQFSLRPKAGYENKYTAMELRTIQDWIVRRQLLGVEGVADVASFGGFLKQYEVAVDPARLKANNVTINGLFTALENNNQNTGGAYIERGPTLLFIRSEGLVGTIQDIENIVVKSTTKGAPVLVRDIAEVRLGHATRYGAMTYNGKEEVAGAVVMMLKGANSNEVIKNIKTRIEAIQKTLPEGVMIDPFLDRTKMINNAIGTVEQNLLEGALIVVFVLVLFLGNFRAGLLVASVIPLSLLFAIIMMNLFGVSGNLMSLGALDFGLIVDGAVIIVEAVMHTLQVRNRTLSQTEMDATVNEVSARMRNAAVYGEIIIFIVYIPIFTLRGIEGKMFLPMAQTVAFALIGAFVLSLTYIPMMSALVLSRKPDTKPNFSYRMMAWLEDKYQLRLEKVLNYPKALLVSTLLFLGGAIFILLQLGGEFIPSLPEGDFAVETRVLPGSNLGTSTRSVSAGAQILLDKFPEVEKVVGKTGSSEIPTDPMPIDASDMMVILKPKKEWTSATTYDELIEKMSQALEAVPGVSFGFQYPVAMRFNELMTGARQDVVCKIYGEDLDTLATYAKKLGEISSSIEGAKDVYVEAVTGMPQVIIDYNRQAIAQYGLNIAEINEIVNTAFAGQSTGLVYEGEKRFDLVVRLIGEQRKSIQDIQDLLIPTPMGAQIPLSAVAKVEVVEGPNQIQREDAQRRIIIGFNIRGRDVQSMVEELRHKVEQQVKLPAGYHITYGGAFESLEQAKNRLSIAVPVSLLLIFLMLYFTFRSVKQGLLIYSAIPLSAIGGVFALALRGMPFSISAGVGFIALFGVAVLNGIVLVAEFNRLRNEGITDIKQVIFTGTRTRLRPVLMTALVASLGFLPMAISNGEGAEVQRPLATVVIGGLLFATLLTLFVLPMLYIMFERKGITRRSGMLAGIVFVAFFPAIGWAQTPISLQSAVDTALKNNLSLKSEQLFVEYLQKLKSTSYNLPQTTASFDYGQINSALNDNRFTIQQVMKFPSVYSKQRTLYNEQWKAGMLNMAIQQNELKKQVTEAYFELVYLQQKQRLLLHTDSLFEAFLHNAALRFNKGESNILEKTTAETQRGQISIQLAALQNDLGIWRLRFKLLLNTSTDLVISDSLLKMTAPIISDSAFLNGNPVLKQLQQQQQTDLARLKLEKSKLMPDLFASYSNMTIRGMGADNKSYSSSDRFQSFQVGVGIPVFFRSYTSSITAMEFSHRLSQNNFRNGLQTMQSRYLQAVLQYRKNLQTIAYYESTALKNAETIISTATTKYKNGDINYLEWILLINNAVTIQSDYLDSTKELNRSIIEINFYTSK